MGCISSKILTRSGSLQEKKASYHGFQRSSSQLIEDIILSSSNSKTKPNGDQPTFLALLRTTSTSSSAAAARNSRVDAAAEQSQSPASAATPAAAAKIETIDVSELLAGLEEEEQGQRDDGNEEDGAAAGRARSFRTVEEFDALVATRSSGSPEQAAKAATGRDASATPPRPPESGSSPSEQEDPATAASGEGDDAGAGAKRRARTRQLRELSAPAAAGGFDFGKSGSLRDWLRGGGQIFSPGSYVTPKFGNATADRSEDAGEEHGAAVFDPELVAQLELAMEELSADEERVMREVLESLDAGEKREEEAERLDLGLERPPNEQATPLVAYLQD